MGGRKRGRNLRTPIMGLPEHIMVEILLRLPLKGIVMCKCTCTTWRLLISSTHFTELHFTHSKTCILVQNAHSKQISRTLHLIEPSEINSNCYCRNMIGTLVSVNTKLDTKLKIPLFNNEELLDSIGDAEASAICRGITNKKPTIKLNPMHGPEFNFDIVNSCNGLLCLISHTGLTIVCNPVTNEYINLPANKISCAHEHTGFGFCQVTKRYKVLRVLATEDQLPIAVEIYTLGINSWKSIGPPPSFYQEIKSPMYFKGFLYWIGTWTEIRIHSFEFSSECFRLLPQPSIILPVSSRIGTIADSLCLCADLSQSICIWLLKNSDGKEFWSSWIEVSTQRLDNWFFHTSLVISCSKCKSFQLLNCHADKIVLFDSKTAECSKLRICQKRFKAKVVNHTPSFLCLKDVAPGANVVSISTGFKLLGETRSPYLRDETWLAGFRVFFSLIHETRDNSMQGCNAP